MNENAVAYVVQPGQQGTVSVNMKDVFQRVISAYDLDLLGTARIIVVGIGGAAGLVDDLARSGIGSMVLIDPDKVTASNLATQQTYAYDIGETKVTSLAKRLSAINPFIAVQNYDKPVEEIDDEIFAGLLERRPTVLCGFTDSFSAQARINRISLHFGIPSLCAQLYTEGRGGEITFMYPGVTSSCHRCMLLRRYRAYLQENYTNTVTSYGSPVFATTRINSLAGQIIMALLHYGTSHPRWGNLLTEIDNRTLALVRVDPRLELPVFERVFCHADTERIFFDETIWSPQVPHLSCPDCGGTGDLRDAKGTFMDTRFMRYSA